MPSLLVFIGLLFIGLLLPGLDRPITDTTAADWVPPLHGIPPGVYAGPQHLLAVHPRWIHAWSCTTPKRCGSYALGALDGDRLVLTDAPTPWSAALPLEVDGRSARLALRGADLCVGRGCAVRLKRFPADLAPVAAQQGWATRGWTAAVLPEQLYLSMRATGKASRVPLDLLDIDSREPPRWLADGWLPRRGGVFVGMTASPPAPAPTAIPIQLYRFHVAWRHAGGVSVWFPARDRDAPASRGDPWRVELTRATAVTPPPIPLNGAGWPQIDPDAIGCRCTAPPCDPRHAPRIVAAASINARGVPYLDAAWLCDRPGAVRRWSLAPLGMTGHLVLEPIPHRGQVRARLEVAGWAPLVGPHQFLDLAPRIGFTGQATLRLEPLQNGRMRVQQAVIRQIPLTRAAPATAEPIVALGPTEALGALARHPDGRFRLPAGLGGAWLERRYGERFAAPIPDGEVTVEWLEGALWVHLQQTAVLPMAP